MDFLSEIFDILKILIPALIVFGTAYFLLKSFLDADKKKRLLELRLNNQKTVTPIRLQAYERLILLMERLSPNSMILRVKKKGMQASDLHAALLREIMTEYEHNITQQLYISDSAWQQTKAAKDQVMNLISKAYKSVNPEDDAMDLSREIFNEFMKMKSSPNDIAISILKKEARENF